VKKSGINFESHVDPTLLLTEMQVNPMGIMAFRFPITYGIVASVSLKASTVDEVNIHSILLKIFIDFRNRSDVHVHPLTTKLECKSICY